MDGIMKKIKKRKKERKKERKFGIERCVCVVYMYNKKKEVGVEERRKRGVGICRFCQNKKKTD